MLSSSLKLALIDNRRTHSDVLMLSMILLSGNACIITLANLFLKLVSAIDFGINAASTHKVEMGTGFDYFAIIEDENPVGSL